MNAGSPTQSESGVTASGASGRSREWIAPLRIRDFRFAFAANALSQVGDQVVPVALAFAVLEQTGSAVALGFVLLARTVPMILFVLFGGVFADRLPRRSLVVASDLVRFASQGAFALLLFVGHMSLATMIILQVINGAATAMYRPAWGGLLPSLLSNEVRRQGVGLMSVASSVANVVGPALAGGLIALGGARWALAFDSITFLGSALLVHRVPIPGRAEQPHTAILADLAEGWHEVAARRWLWAWVCNFGAFQFLVLAVFSVLGPLVAQTSLGGAKAWATISVGSGLGSVVGGILAVRVKPKLPLLVIAAGLAGAPLMLFGLAIPLEPVAIAGLAAFYGLALTFVDAVWAVTVQNHIPPVVLSRVVSYDWLGSSLLRPLGLAVAAPVALLIGVRGTLIGAAILYLSILCVTALLPETRTMPWSPDADRG